MRLQAIEIYGTRGRLTFARKSTDNRLNIDSQTKAADEQEPREKEEKEPFLIMPSSAQAEVAIQHRNEHTRELHSENHSMVAFVMELQISARPSHEAPFIRYSAQGR